VQKRGDEFILTEFDREEHHIIEEDHLAPLYDETSIDQIAGRWTN
jgi:hypothetical protein